MTLGLFGLCKDEVFIEEYAGPVELTIHSLADTMTELEVSFDAESCLYLCVCPNCSAWHSVQIGWPKLTQVVRRLKM